MSENTQGLSAEERAELEQLRAEKAAREQAARDRAERAELERLKAERDRKRAEAEKDAHARELRERNAKLMEPDDDLRMPVGQKVVLAVVFVAVVAIFPTIVMWSNSVHVLQVFKFGIYMRNTIVVAIVCVMLFTH